MLQPRKPAGAVLCMALAGRASLCPWMTGREAHRRWRAA